jgi:hypothetical protein
MRKIIKIDVGSMTPFECQNLLATLRHENPITKFRYYLECWFVPLAIAIIVASPGITLLLQQLLHK